MCMCMHMCMCMLSCPRLPLSVPQVVEGVKVGVNLHAHRSNLRTRVLAGCAAEEAAGGAAVSHTFGFESTPGATPLARTRTQTRTQTLTLRLTLTLALTRSGGARALTHVPPRG